MKIVQNNASTHLLNERKLVERLNKNDESAFEELVHHYSTKMYSVARKFFPSDDDAQECLQKSFIQVFENISSFNHSSSLSTWLHRITVNSALMMLRHKKSQKTISLEEYSQHYNEFGERELFTNNISSTSKTMINERGNPLSNHLETLFEKNEQKIALTDIIFALPEKYCNVLLLRDIQELSTTDTAQILSLSEAAVKTQLHRARLFLKAILEQQDNDRAEKNWQEN